MTHEEMERAIEFLIDHHAKFSTDMEQLKEAMGELKEAQVRQTENIDKLTASVEAMQAEMREGFEKLILSNEVTRDLAAKAAQLAIQTSQRVTDLESR